MNKYKKLKQENEMLRTLLAMILFAFEKVPALKGREPTMIMNDGPLKGQRVDVVQSARNYIQSIK